VSAVKSTIIVRMQPNPGDTTNVQLIRIAVDGKGAVNLSDLSSSTGYVSSTVWMQVFAYTSLSFSVLIAFGAVVGWSLASGRAS
jgi:hypothetical protein